MPNDRLLRLEDVAYRLGISHTAVRMLVLYEQAIPHVKVGVRGIRVKESVLEAYIKELEEAQSGSKKHRAD